MLRYGLLIIGLLFFSAFSNAQESLRQFYLLRTGYLLEGTATQNNKHYIVQTSFGSMNVPIQNVEFIGKTKNDVYLYRRNNVDLSDGNALIQFAEWCLGYGLTQEGIAEYHRASQVITSGTLAAVIQQRLEGLHRMEPVVAQQPTQEPQPEVSPNPTISKSVFENYVRKVQPMLANKCASADCHGTHSKQQFKMGISQESMGSTSRRNLRAALVYVNLDHPADSDLLSALITPHGGMKTAALSVESEQYLQTVRWVQQVAKEIPLERNAQKPPSHANVAAPVKVSVLPEQFRRAIPKTECPPVQELQPQEVVHPLDPNVFNAKYHK